MHCPDERDADLYHLVQSSHRGSAPSGGGVPIVVGMSMDEYEARRDHALRVARRARLSEIEALLPPEPEVSAELQHARKMRAEWEAHAAGVRPTGYAIEQAGYWRRRVEALEFGPVAEEIEQGKIVPMPKPKRRRTPAAKRTRRVA
jgi:hypothetical protein